jgi:hypothetical protein
MIRVGVVGPRDLVGHVASVAREFPAVAPVTLPYRHEKDTVKILHGAPADVDAWLFTGVVPYEVALASNLPNGPAAYVDYTGATLLRAVVELMSEGGDVSRMSIDTLTDDQVRETLQESRLATDGVRVLPYRPGLSSEEIVEFHRGAADELGDHVAVTCLRSAYDVLRRDDDGRSFRLTPSIHSVRAAFRQLLLTLDSRQSGNAQVVFGLVELTTEPDRLLRQESARLAGSLLPYGGRRHLIVTTRGALEAATGSFSEFPALNRLAERYGSVRIGFGVGASAAEAETLAKRALGRARAASRATAVVSLRHEVDIALAGGQGTGAAGRRPSLAVLAQRSGLSTATLQRLRELPHEPGSHGLTTRDVAARLDVQPRTARRILNRLERTGLARTVGTQSLNGSGRPLLIYELDI